MTKLGGCEIKRLTLKSATPGSSPQAARLP